MRLSRIGLLAAAVLALSACAPQITTGLPDEPKTEASDAAKDRASDPKANVPALVDAPSQAQDSTPSTVDQPVNEPADQSAILARHANLDPTHLVPRNLLATALTYFEDHAASIANKNYVSVIDFSLPSTKQRFFIINMATGAVFATTVAHGKNSDKNNDGYAEAFSNTQDSEMSSLGIYVTAETYTGTHGLSLRLDGKSTTNSNVRARAIVLHGADYVQDKEVRQGRSWGCPAVPMEYRDKLVGWLKQGSVIYAGQSLK